MDKNFATDYLTDTSMEVKFQLWGIKIFRNKK